jgi:hypothetical protein
MRPLDDGFLRRCIPWTMHPLDDASLGRCVPWSMCLLDNASLGRCVSWTMRPLFDASLGRCVSLPGGGGGGLTLGWVGFGYGRFVQGMYCLRDASSKGRMVPEKTCGDASSCHQNKVRKRTVNIKGT